MIVDVPQGEAGLAEKLQQLLDALPPSHPKRKLVEADLYRVRGGEKGERGVAYHPRFWYGEAGDVVIANGLRLVFGDRVAQIDHLVGVPGELLVLESKALPDRVRITPAGDWVRLKWANGKLLEEGIYNPAEQNSRHIAVLADVLRDLGVDRLPPLVSVVVLPRPEVVVDGYRSGLGYRLVRVDRLRALIDERRRLPAAACGPAGNLVSRLLRYHVPAELDVYARYGIDPKEMLPLKERVRFDPDLRGYRCAFCGSKMALLKNRMGLAWGCSGYPQCRNLVPASVVVQVGQEAAEEQKGRGFLAALFGPKLKVCPSCGSVLEWRDVRGGAWYCPNSRLYGYRPN